MIAGAVRDDAAGRLFGRELADGIGGAAELERADLLELFALEKERPTRAMVERLARVHRRDVSPTRDALGRGPDIVDRGGVRHSDFLCSPHAPRAPREVS